MILVGAIDVFGTDWSIFGTVAFPWVNFFFLWDHKRLSYVEVIV